MYPLSLVRGLGIVVFNLCCQTKNQKRLKQMMSDGRADLVNYSTDGDLFKFLKLPNIAKI